MGLADRLGEAPRRLSRIALDAGGVAGAVASWDVGEGPPSPRAFFLALAERSVPPWAAALAGFDADAAERALPYRPGFPSTFGVAVDDLRRWTAYYKPERSPQASYRLEPSASFSDGVAEVGLFVEPVHRAERAYARTSAFAISYRAREGTPDPRVLGVLVAWAAATLEAAGASADPDACLRATPPPAPWRLAPAARRVPA
jgi:hypothetical protein